MSRIQKLLKDTDSSIRIYIRNRIGAKLWTIQLAVYAIPDDVDALTNLVVKIKTCVILTEICFIYSFLSSSGYSIPIDKSGNVEQHVTPNNQLCWGRISGGVI